VSGLTRGSFSVGRERSQGRRRLVEGRLEAVGGRSRDFGAFYPLFPRH
jgi:hypothetical protein